MTPKIAFKDRVFSEVAPGWTARPKTSHITVPRDAKTPYTMRTVRHSRASASGTLRNMAVATPIPCAARLTAFIMGRSLVLNHCTMTAAVAGSRMALPIAKATLSGRMAGRLDVSGAKTPAVISSPLTRMAPLVPSLVDIMPPGMRKMVKTRNAVTIMRLTLPLLRL